MSDDTFDDYRARPGINWSRLKLARISALAYRDTPPRKDTASLGMLRAVHALVLEPENFGADFAVYQGKTRQGKEWEAFKVEHEGKTILNVRESTDAAAIAAAVMRYEPAAGMLGAANCRTEVSLYWDDITTLLQCKGRADIIVEFDDEVWLVDLKTVRSINPRQMASDAARMGYHGQLAHYAAGVEAMTGKPVTRWGLLCVEGAAPHDVGLYWLDDEARDAGRALRDDLLQRVNDAARDDVYPGQCPEPADLSLPAWAIDAATGFDDTFTSTEN